MSQTSQRRRVSREGLMLIKSLEGFSPRAAPREDGLWVIGYGHTRSAREGLTVTEAEAELLLQYDLLPVVAVLNDGPAAQLNQHQFDALASYGLSIGADALAGSAVLAAVADGAEATARTLAGAADEDGGLARPGRRRAAEAALFTTDPEVAVTVAQILNAPLPPPPETPTPPPETPDVVVAETVAPDTFTPDTFTPDTAAPLAEARFAAVAHFLPDEPDLSDARAVDAPSVVETPAAVEPVAVPPQPANDVEAPAPGPDAEQDARNRAMAQLTRLRFSPYGHSPVGPLMQPQPLAPPPPSNDGEAAPLPPPITPQFAPATSADFTDAPATAAPPQFTLTPEEETPTPEREVWPEAQRETLSAFDQAEAESAPLFGADADLDTSFGPILRHEALEAEPRGVDWGETGAFAAMGAVGFISLGAAAAALRVVFTQGAGANGETALIGGALTLIGGACVGVSALNLYRRFGPGARPGDGSGD